MSRGADVRSYVAETLGHGLCSQGRSASRGESYLEHIATFVLVDRHGRKCTMVVQTLLFLSVSQGSTIYQVVAFGVITASEQARANGVF